MTLHIFNPEHDMALAANSTHWNSPHAGRQLRTELGWIPALWAKDGDVIMVDDVDSAKSEYFRFKCNIQKRNVSFRTLAELKDISGINRIIPWGWDPSLCNQLKRAGINNALLPSVEDITHIRKVSGRQTTLQMLPYLRQGLENHTCGEVCVVKDIEELNRHIGLWHNVVVKSPWSCSGRGVRYVLNEVLTDNFLNWFNNSLHLQGEMLVEPFHESVMDFGMEFETINGKSQYRGLSLFDTANGAYTGSLLATESEKRTIMQHFVSLGLLDSMAERICTFIDAINKGTYEGAYGVDMMIVKKNDKLLLNPCIELNFRRTMGHTALALSPTENGNKQIMRIGFEGKHYHIRLFNHENWLY